MQNYCVECGGVLLYDLSIKRYSCKSCGLYITKEQLLDLQDKMKEKEGPKKRKQEHHEYLEWWLSKK